jgi:aryl-alcohol dehydrogenase-like predicted oxidoreductase
MSEIELHYNSLGRTGVKVSNLCLGCMNFGGRTAEAEAIEIIHAALDAGINFIDTANVYGHNPGNYSEGRGRSEKIVGQALHGRREGVVLASKVHFPMSDDVNASGNSRRHIIEQCEDSLKRLNTDYLDLYQLHSSQHDIPIDETLRALDDLIRAGKLRYVGTSGFASWEFMEALWASKELVLNRFVSEQPPYNLLDRRIEREFIALAQTYDVAILPWGPTAGGFFSGKYRRDADLPENSRYSEFWRSFGAEQFANDAIFSVLDVVEALAAEKDCPPYDIALRWVMVQPGVTSTIIGPRTIQQLHGSMQALAVEISEEDQMRLDAVTRPGGALVVYGREKWQPHRFRW